MQLTENLGTTVSTFLSGFKAGFVRSTPYYVWLPLLTDTLDKNFSVERSKNSDSLAQWGGGVM